MTLALSGRTARLRLDQARKKRDGAVLVTVLDRELTAPAE